MAAVIPGIPRRIRCGSAPIAWGFENPANGDKLSPSGAVIFCIPIKIGKRTREPARIFALLP